MRVKSLGGKDDHRFFNQSFQRSRLFFYFLFSNFFSNYSCHVILYYLFQAYSIVVRHLYTSNLQSDPPNKSRLSQGSFMLTCVVQGKEPGTTALTLLRQVTC